MPKISRRLIIWLIVLAVVIAVFFTLILPGNKAETLPTSELISDLQQGKSPSGGNYTTADLTIKDTSLTAVIDGVTYTTTIPSDFDAFQVFATQIDQGSVTVNYQGPTWWGKWGVIIVTAIASLFVGACFGYLRGRAAIGTRSKPK